MAAVKSTVKSAIASSSYCGKFQTVLITFSSLQTLPTQWLPVLLSTAVFPMYETVVTLNGMVEICSEISVAIVFHVWNQRRNDK